MHTVKSIGSNFEAAMGAEAIKRLLEKIDLEDETQLLKEELKICTRSTPYTCD